MQTLDNMTQAAWNQLSPAAKDRARDLSGLTPQLIGLEGARVEVVDTYGARRRFWVRRSTGWRPCHIEAATTRSLGGLPADNAYRSARVIRWR
jgi:hypothetical protein